MSDETPQKICRDCEVSYPRSIEYFKRQSKRTETLDSCCRECRRQKQQQHWRENRERLLEKRRAYKAAHREKVLEQNRRSARKSRAANLERMREYQRLWYHANAARLRQKRSKPPRPPRQPDPLAKEKRAAYKKAYHIKHREKLIAYSRAYHAAHREKHILQSRANYAKNRAANREKARQYRVAHLQKRRAYEREYYVKHFDKIRLRWQRNPEVYQAAGSRYRARKKAAFVNDFSAAQWREMKAAYGYRCVYCGKKAKALTQDHLIPLSKGGTHTAPNILPACRSCNSRKHTGPPLIPVQPLLLTVAQSCQKKICYPVQAL